jgi:hypothetical protein
MQINLRKANAVQQEIRRAINDISFKTDVSVNEFTKDVEGVIALSSSDFASDYTRKLQLINALYEIRREVARQNVQAGIADVLASIAEVDESLRVVTEVSKKTERKSAEEISARLEKLKTNTNSERASVYGDRYNNVETSVLTDATIRMAKASVKEFKRRRQDLNDKLLQLNVNTLITLSEDTKAILKEDGIL